MTTTPVAASSDAAPAADDATRLGMRRSALVAGVGLAVPAVLAGLINVFVLDGLVVEGNAAPDDIECARSRGFAPAGHRGPGSRRDLLWLLIKGRPVGLYGPRS